MKSVLKVLVPATAAGILLLTTIGSAFAQATPTATPVPPTATPAPTTPTLIATQVTPAATPAAALLEVHGTVTALAKTATPPTVALTPKTGAAVTVKIAANTKITKAGIGKATLDDLAVDDRAVASYNKDTLEASSLHAVPAQSKHHGFEGTIKSVTAGGFVLTTKKGATDVTIVVNAETKFKVPGAKDATFSSFKVGDRAAVLTVDAKSSNVALHVHLIPGKPSFMHGVGTVEAYQAGQSITLKNAKGESFTFALSADTKIRGKRGATAPVVGERAMVSGQRNPSSDQLTAKSIVLFGTKGQPAGQQDKGQPDDKGKPDDKGTPNPRGGR